MVPWRNLEPQDGTFDWAQMDANVADARQNGYQLILRVMGGRMVPGWLIDTSDPEAAASVRMLGTDQNAADYCNWLNVPVPWDLVLRSQYTELMTEVGRWLNEGDGAGGRNADHVQLVPISMPTVLGTEMVIGYGGNITCPDGKGGAGLNLSATNRAAWDAVSTETGRRAEVETAWRRAIGIHMTVLPSDVRSVIAYGAVFGDAQAAALRIASSEIAGRGDRLWSMYTNLQPQVRSDGTLGPWRDWCGRCHEVLTAAIASGGEVGFQSVAGGANDTLQEFSSAANDALATYGMRFLETQPPNVDKYKDYLLVGPDSLQERIREANQPPPDPHATSTAVACGTATAGIGTTCTATVADLDAAPSAPAGTVTWSAANGSVTGGCELVANGTSSSCGVTFAGTAAGPATVTASYGGSDSHQPSSGQASFTVGPRGSATSVTCASPVTLPSSSSCTATVRDTSSGATSAPSGSVTWSTSGAGSFSAPSCTLAASSASAATCSVNYTPTASGSHTVTASFGGDARHSSSTGTATVSAQSPPAGDTTAPTVSITSPANGSVARRGTTVTITASASDNVGVTRVVFSVNSTTLCTDTSPSWSCSWRVTKSGTGATLTARAYDAAGNNASSSVFVSIR